MHQQLADFELANRILLALPSEELQRIRHHLTPVVLERGHIIYHPDATIKKLYFVNRGLISLVRTMKDGRTVEVGTIGIEGLAGFPALLDIDRATLECVVQLSGNALCGSLDVLRYELSQNQHFAGLLHRYYHLIVGQIAQTAACNRLHSLEQRCCRWLLVAHDNARSDSFLLTQEFLAAMLGVQRAGVSIAAKSLQQAGLIRYNRGHMTITDRVGLEAASCECFDSIRHLTDHLFPR